MCVCVWPAGWLVPAGTSCFNRSLPAVGDTTTSRTATNLVSQPQQPSQLCAWLSACRCCRPSHTMICNNFTKCHSFLWHQQTMSYSALPSSVVFSKKQPAAEPWALGAVSQPRGVLWCPYSGGVSCLCVQDLAAEIRAAGGIMTAQDLLEAQPSVKQPITAQVCTACTASTRSLSLARSLAHSLTHSLPVNLCLSSRCTTAMLLLHFEIQHCHLFIVS